MSLRTTVLTQPMKGGMSSSDEIDAAARRLDAQPALAPRDDLVAYLATL